MHEYICILEARTEINAKLFSLHFNEVIRLMFSVKTKQIALKRKSCPWTKLLKCMYNSITILRYIVIVQIY